jgi:hypothetical protein
MRTTFGTTVTSRSSYCSSADIEGTEPCGFDEIGKHFLAGVASEGDRDATDSGVDR